MTKYKANISVLKLPGSLECPTNLFLKINENKEFKIHLEILQDNSFETMSLKRLKKLFFSSNLNYLNVQLVGVRALGY